MIERPAKLSRLGLGCYPLGGGYGAIDELQARTTIEEALEHGWTFFDAAESYLKAEDRLGRILQGRRDEVFLATKVFPTEPYTYANLRAALEGSLRRLRTDRVDLYQLHGPESWVLDHPETPAADLGESLQRLLESGKVLHVGVSNLPVERVRALAEHVPIFSAQELYSLYDREHERGMLALCRERGIAFISYSPLSRGLLADDLDPGRRFREDDERRFLPRFRQPVYREYVRVSRALQRFANERGRTLAELAVAWTLRAEPVASTLVGAKRPEHVRAVAGSDAWHLSEEELAEIDALVATLSEEARRAPYATWDHFEKTLARSFPPRVRETG